MKSILKTLCALFLTGAVIVSCSKQGPVEPAGPQGQQGATGQQGPVGPAGPAGKDGSQLYAGTGTPPSSTGVTGDYYLDKSTGELYGPKTSSGWGSPLNLTGPQWQAGQNGSKIYSGAGSPSNSTGVTGDYYLDTADVVLYGPKINSGWGMGIQLRGKEGNANVLVFWGNIESISPMINEFNYITTTGDSVDQWNYFYFNAMIPIHSGSDTLYNGSLSGVFLYYGYSNTFYITRGWYPLNSSIINPSFIASTYTQESESPYIVNSEIVGILSTMQFYIEIKTPSGSSGPSSIFNSLYLPPTMIKIVYIYGSNIQSIATKYPGVNFRDYGSVSKALHLDE